MNKKSKAYIHSINLKQKEMINISKNTCLEIGCVKRPCFNFEGEKKGIYCSKHAKETMVSVTTTRCYEIGCKIRPSFNFEGEKKSL